MNEFWYYVSALFLFNTTGQRYRLDDCSILDEWLAPAYRCIDLLISWRETPLTSVETRKFGAFAIMFKVPGTPLGKEMAIVRKVKGGYRVSFPGQDKRVWPFDTRDDAIAYCLNILWS